LILDAVKISEHSFDGIFMSVKICGTVLILLLAQQSGANEFSSWSDKTICRLLSDSSASKQEPYLNEAVSRGLDCIPENLGAVSKDKTVASSIEKPVLKAPKTEADLELIKAKAKSKKFGLFNNPGKEIKKLLSEGKVTEAYYIYTYNIAFFRQKGTVGGKIGGKISSLLGGETNSVKFNPQLKLLARSYYQKDNLMMADSIKNLIKFNVSENKDDIEGWANVKKALASASSIRKTSHNGSDYSNLIAWASKRAYFLSVLQNIEGYYYKNAKRLFASNAFKKDQNFFEVYPVVLATSGTKLLSDWMKELDDKGIITSDHFKTYENIYDFKTLLGANRVKKIKVREELESSLNDKSTSIFQLINMAGKNSDPKSLFFLKRVFADRGVSVDHPNPSDNYPLIVECLKRSCVKKANAQIQMIITFEGGSSNAIRVGTLNERIRVKSGTNSVPNPAYNSIARELDGLARSINQKRQQEANRQANSSNTYDTNCTTYGSNINCTTNQNQGNAYYNMGLAGGALMGKGVNALLGLKTEEDRYRKLSNRLSRTSRTIQKQAYSYQNIEIPEYEVTKVAAATVHIFDVKNKEYQSVPVSLASSKKWLVPNSESVFSLPLKSDVKRRLLASNLINLKISEYMTLDVISNVTSALSGGGLISHEYIEPSSLNLREQLKRDPEVKTAIIQPKVEGQSTTPSAEVSSDSGYYELLGNDQFVKWAKSDPILNRLLQGFVEGNEKAIEVLTKKWIERN